jgi:predicted DNA-binding protein (MmcQ/YjbR family)
MDIETLRAYCLSLPFASEYTPFDESTLAFRVGEKIFALLPLNTADRVNLKCDPEQALTLRDSHPEILPGYHMNKKHWNTVMLNGTLTDKLVMNLVLHSYQLVFNSLPKKKKDQLKQKGQDD